MVTRTFRHRERNMKHLIALILTVPQSLMAGLVFSKTWNWFIVRKFENLPHLGTLDSIGILFVLGIAFAPLAMINARKEIKEKSPERDEGDISIAIALVMTLITYPVLLGIGALWHLFIN